jgi:hypothetical protein
MAESRSRELWDHTATLWPALVNPNRDTKEHPKPYTFFDIHPYRNADDYKPELPSVVEIKDMFPQCRAVDP